MAKSHPHLDFPTSEQLQALVVCKPQIIADTYLALHSAVLDALPDVIYSVDEIDTVIGYGAHQYGYNGWGMAAISPFTKWASLTFFAGPRLNDPDKILQGTSRAMRHVKMSTPEEVTAHRDAITALVLGAATINVG